MKTLILLFSVLFTTMSFAQVPSYVPANGLVGWWPFNGNANDESGNGNNGSNNGATLTTDRNGNVNSAYSFDPNSNSNINIPFSSSLNSIQNGITLSAWIYMDGGTPAGTPPRILELRGAYGGGGDAGFVMLATDNNNSSRAFELRWYSNNGNSNLHFSPTNSTLTSLNWHLISFTADGIIGVAKYYFDGVLQSTSTNDIITQCNYNNNPLIIGAEPNLLGKWGGKLDDIGIWNRALTQQEITNLYTSTVPVSCLPAYVPTSGLVGYWPFCGNANDESGNGNNGTNNGATLTTDRNGNVNSAYNFDGVNDIIQLGDLNYINAGVPGEFSISIWLNINQFNTELGGGQCMLIGDEISQNNGTLLQVSTNYGFGSYTAGSSGWYCGCFPNLNNWIYYTVVQDQVGQKLFINGQLWGQLTSLQNSEVSAIVRMGLFDGCSGPCQRPLNGKLDDIGIWNRALTDCEIQNLYTSTNPSNTTTATACGSYVWNGQTYSASGVYTDISNCVTESLNLTINQSTSSSISQTALDSYTWPVNNQTYTTTGAYTAVIPNAAGCDSTITLNLAMSFTGINDLSASKLSIYPNPTNGDFTITGLELVGTVSSLSLTDMNGKVVKVLDTKATKFTMASIKPGVYFLNIRAGNKQEVLKIVKE